MNHGPTVTRSIGRFDARRWTVAVGLVAVLSLLLLAAALSVPTRASAAEAPVGLGTTATYSVLGGQAVTNTGPSVLNGDVGVSPGTAITGFPPGITGGTLHSADAAAGGAQSDLVIAYNDAAGRAPIATIAGDLGGLTLTAGVYGPDGYEAVEVSSTRGSQSGCVGRTISVVVVPPVEMRGGRACSARTPGQPRCSIRSTAVGLTPGGSHSPARIPCGSASTSHTMRGGRSAHRPGAGNAVASSRQRPTVAAGVAVTGGTICNQ